MAHSGPRAVDLAVVMPAGPADDVADSVSSILRYTSSQRLVVVVDDTGGTGTDMAEVDAMDDTVVVIPAPFRAPGGQGGLWVKVAAGCRYALSHADFDLLLRIDGDALMLGPGLVDQARRAVEMDPKPGILGACRFGPDGGLRDWTPAARQLRAEIGPAGLRYPGVRRCLKFLYVLAHKNGYTDGAHALGGANLMTGPMLRYIDAQGWLELGVLAKSNLGEDHIFGLLCFAAGYGLIDFSGPDDPMAVKWRGLPASPGSLLARQKLVTHSVRSWEQMDEGAIRAQFRADRNKDRDTHN